jgi:two-component system response regulator HydG
MSKSLRILIVDDDRDNADSLAELFELEGHRPSVVYDGEAAIRAYEEANFDLAFMDVMMPGRNGVESFLEIKRSKAGARVFMMTGYSVEQLLQQALDGGALGVVTKPIDLPRLMADLARIAAETREGIVLVAEDDPAVGEMLYTAITASGRRCELVREAPTALEQLEDCPADVMVLDLALPLIDGIDVYARLKARGRAVTTVIVTGTGERHQDALEALRDMEVTGILQKPFDPAELLASLDRLAA